MSRERSLHRSIAPILIIHALCTGGLALALSPSAPPLASCPSWREELLQQKVCSKLAALPRREAELECTSDTAAARKRWGACPLMCGAPCLPSADHGTFPDLACVDSRPEFCANKQKKSLSKGGSATDFCYNGDNPLVKCEKTCGYCRRAPPLPHSSSSLPQCSCSAFRDQSVGSLMDVAQVPSGTLCFHTEHEHYGASWDTITVCSSPSVGGDCSHPGAQKCIMHTAPPAPPPLPPSTPAPGPPPPAAVIGEEVTGQEAYVKLKGEHMTYLPWLFVPPRPPSTPPVGPPPPITPQPLSPPLPPASPPSAPPPSPSPAVPCPEACYTTQLNGNNIPQWRKCSISSQRRGQRGQEAGAGIKYGPRYCDACPICYLSPATPPAVPPPAAPPPPMPPLHPMCSQRKLDKNLCKVISTITLQSRSCAPLLPRLAAAYSPPPTLTPTPQSL